MDKGFRILLKILLTIVIIAIAAPALFFVGMVIAGLLGYL